MVSVLGNRIPCKVLIDSKLSISWTSCLVFFEKLNLITYKLKLLEIRMRILFYGKKAKKAKEVLVPIYLRVAITALAYKGPFLDLK